MSLSQACLEEEVVDHQTHHEGLLGRDVLSTESLQRILYCPCYGLMEEVEEEGLCELRVGSAPVTVASRWGEVGAVLICAEDLRNGC